MLSMSQKVGKNIIGLTNMFSGISVTTPGYRDYNWYGSGAKDHNVLMHGKLFEKDSARYGKNKWVLH